MVAKSSINTSLTFKVGKVLYATHTDTVQNVIYNPSTTSISNASWHSKGAMYLGKTDLPAIDFHSKFGLLADGVVRVMFIRNPEAEPTPTLAGTYKSCMVQGITKIEGNATTILGTTTLLSDLGTVETLASKSEVIAKQETVYYLIT